MSRTAVPVTRVRAHNYPKTHQTVLSGCSSGVSLVRRTEPEPPPKRLILLRVVRLVSLGRIIHVLSTHCISCAEEMVAGGPRWTVLEMVMLSRWWRCSPHTVGFRSTEYLYQFDFLLCD
ncbi:hypothetical protein HYPBUDRAFT_195430 [Hyphopichia burtonii NRRL Y-1933]|uniref:Uncharacterized protein n=1 Tax=Hyphopichia burtonii NRRL Y-1933 TaxID=984485 RepID=A0A1E4RJG8_9ASCO|nr:hypothetical protein HYPBUDRAFT_195430 [Hyphopichia burtonii NRRL Y-1933]ODV67422.1 hypothetical protein HYPBUDRAFT_195430 [Hyphopichia burtonii NRRL Y-1933]